MNPIITDVELAWAAFKNWIVSSETWLVTLIKAEWNLDRQLLIQDLTADLKSLGNTLQSQNGGISGKELGSALLAALEGQFAAQVSAMLWQDALLAVSLATNSLNPPATPGNGGVLQGGVQAS